MAGSYHPLLLQSREPFPLILCFSDPRIGVLPQVKGSLVMLDGFSIITLLFVDLAEHVEGFGVDVAIINSYNKGIDPLIFCLSLFGLVSKSTPNCLSRYPPCLG
jgi:hypothetical protein